MKTIELKEGSTIYYYNVEINFEELEKIKQKLLKYAYKTVEQGTFFIGNGQLKRINRFTTRERLRKKVTKCFYEDEDYKNCFLHPETIEKKQRDIIDYITFEYSYNKLPDLFFYLDILINGKNETNSKIYRKYVLKIKDSEEKLAFLIEKIMEYESSQELHQGNPKNVINEKEYDYEGLNELYQKVLENIKLTLIGKKELIEQVEGSQPTSLKMLIRERNTKPKTTENNNK